MEQQVFKIFYHYFLYYELFQFCNHSASLYFLGEGHRKNDLSSLGFVKGVAQVCRVLMSLVQMGVIALIYQKLASGLLN